MMPDAVSDVVALMRHGDALSSSEDPARPLSVIGRQHAERIASWLGRLEWRLAEVRHSGLLRAQQTAEIVAERLALRDGITARMAGLAPNDDPEEAARELEALRRPLVVVGHLPNLRRLASLLVTGHADRLDVRFSDAGVVLLEPRLGPWRLISCASHETV